MRTRVLWLGLMVVVSSGAVGYLGHRVLHYQRMKRNVEIEDALAARIRDLKDSQSDGNHGLETPPVISLNPPDPLKEKEIPVEGPSPDPHVTEPTPPETPAENIQPAVVVIPPGRVSGSDPDRATLAANIVVPELAPALTAKGLRAGDPIFIRILKAEGELELWIFHRQDQRYRLFKTYAVAAMSGQLGPKLAEGDFQAPEGFYFVGRGRMNPLSSFHLSFDVGYPNAFDRAHGRTGTYLMVHGNQISAGCFAMTDNKIEEIYTLADAALKGGQPFFRVHIFPFRMDDAVMEVVRGHKWFAFWENLREGYSHFERRGIPPDVSVANKIYTFSEATPPRTR